jgi:hypothetical protein
MGGDAAAIASGDITYRRDPKVFENGEFLIGFTSSFRMGQLLRYSFTPPPIEGEDLYRYMCTHFVDALRECFKQGGYATRDKDAEAGGCFLVGVRGHLYEIDEDYQVGESLDAWASVGCGYTYAKGALQALDMVRREWWAQGKHTVDNPYERYMVCSALDAAAQYSTGVCPPFTVLTQGALASLNISIDDQFSSALEAARKWAASFVKAVDEGAEGLANLAQFGTRQHD